MFFFCTLSTTSKKPVLSQKSDMAKWTLLTSGRSPVRPESDHQLACQAPFHKPRSQSALINKSRVLQKQIILHLGLFFGGHLLYWVSNLQFCLLPELVESFVELRAHSSVDRSISYWALTAFLVEVWEHFPVSSYHCGFCLSLAILIYLLISNVNFVSENVKQI